MKSSNIDTRSFLPPQIPVNRHICKHIFLAGTIDMGASENWQDKIPEDIKQTIEKIGLDNDVVLKFMNPRRDSWDSSWEQKYNTPEFNHQVNWELDNIEQSDIVIINFLEDSKSPITLLELGLLAGTKNPEQTVIVHCPEKFYRAGNVEIVCRRYGIQLYSNYETFLLAITRAIIN